ncbi:hypothetical protein KFL_004700120 [Klebsormidium nitens]|uniref:Rhodanese domain-containing protein n=1 Tax=Klebsormidium nitens TaxID=105231 RepID=A0A1Y1IDD8_KLENI|nr:hypothetical protein KFL_004700120 [Klebsormidium nitens]|eukprot:GAQ88930.1 hypothetical protein KFL_004700120 [Klebsormidium nitens]
MPPCDESGISGGKDGVLLYYKYVPISDVPLIVKWYEDLCTSLGLVGRIRVSPEGVNVTIGGSTVALEEHIEQVCSHPSLGSCDFKVAHCVEPLLANPVLVQECGFESLSVRAVKEVVSLGNVASHATSAVAGTHLSPTDFHQHLLAAATRQAEDVGRPSGGVVVLDARNVYETRIGRFQQLPGVEFCDPRIRQFSDLPAWLDANEDRLLNKHVYMYCTGGVRCERASAYLRVKGPGFRNVYQLSGGIQRYLEAFPEGGLFAGKNFVFDPRVAVGSTNKRKVGRCLLCQSPFDDYSPRCRCSQCRLLVLVCGDCRERTESAAYVCELCQDAGAETRAAFGNESGVRVSELGKEQVTGSEVGDASLGDDPSAVGTGSETEVLETGTSDADGQKGRVIDSSVESGTDAFSDRVSGRETGSHGEEALSRRSAPQRRLRVLCLHGFRQTGRGLKGRLAAFQRHLGDLLELVFVDGPFELPCVYYPKELGGGIAGSGEGEESAKSSTGGAGGFGVEGACERTRGVDRAERGAEGRVREREVSPQTEVASGERECSTGKATSFAGLSSDPPAFHSVVRVSGSTELNKQASKGPFPKFAWLVSPEQLLEIERSGDSSGPVKETAVPDTLGDDVDTRTFAETAAVEIRLEDSTAEKGKAFGRSEEADQRAGNANWRPASARFGPLQYLTQTAGWETSLAHLRRLVSEHGPFDGVLGFSQGAAVAAALCRCTTTADGFGDKNESTFRFAVLCSGFPSPAEGTQGVGPQRIDLPSLHVFGSVKGNDRQIAAAESERLAEQFEPRPRVIVRHSAGHIIPVSRSHVNQYRSFFLKAL